VGGFRVFVTAAGRVHGFRNVVPQKSRHTFMIPVGVSKEVPLF
jgi:hypothetical protein